MADVSNQLECYLVGGAVRDELLGREVEDRDWVVVGSTPKKMRSLGFKAVGRDFPVFLHPQTHEEYALARTERKTGVGHTAFEVVADPTVTLRDDLKRRDLTINAIAKSRDGELIDPHDGVDDLQAGILRHVSEAFAEDPLRVFRVARLAAVLEGFTVAHETYELMTAMCASGEVDVLSAERVWQETAKALSANAPQRYFEVLDDCGGLTHWYPELDPDIDFIGSDAEERWGSLGLTQLSLDEISALGRRLKTPTRYTQRAWDVAAHAGVLSRWRRCEGAELLDAFTQLQVVHDLDRVSFVARLIDADAKLVELARQFAAERWRVEGHLEGPAYGQALRELQLEWLHTHRARFS